MGTISIIPHDMEDRRQLTPWLAALYVDPPFRNQGIGEKLISYVIDKADEFNFRSIYLFTTNQERYYAKLGWKLLDKRVYRSEDVSIMDYSYPDNETEQPPIREYLTHLHTYVYNLKKEAEERAKSILTANAIFLASLTWTLKLISEFYNTHDAALVYVALSFCVLGFSLAVVSVYFSLKTFFPVVIDADSPMEPIEILKSTLDEAINNNKSLSIDEINRALTRELRAVSELQIIRSNIVGISGKFFIYSLFFLAGAFVATVFLFFIE